MNILTKKILMAIGVLVVGGLLAYTAFAPNAPKVPESQFQINDLKGNLINHQNLQGKVTLINFWFPSCPGCVSEMPKLIKMSQDYQAKNSDFQILGVATPIDPISSVHEYVETRKLPFTIIFDEHKNLTKLFVKTELYPTSILINKQGEIIKTFVGEPNFPDLYKIVDAELNKNYIKNQ